MAGDVNLFFNDADDGVATAEIEVSSMNYQQKQAVLPGYPERSLHQERVWIEEAC